MGLLQKACETYDNFTHLAGVQIEGSEPLAPISHTLTSAQLEITISGEGEFITARAVDKSEPKIIIPVTEESAGRTSAACAHPLCDNLAYLAEFDEKKHSLYLNQLADWEASEYSHPKLAAIKRYIEGGAILGDLASKGAIELNESGKPTDEKALVRWVVEGLGLEDSGPCWNDLALFRSFTNYYSHRRESGEERLCMITGGEEQPAAQHPKGIIPINGNAKLISANDKTNFTYRGRFSDDWQAATVGYAASQKAHNALRWIAANNGVRAALPGDSPTEVKDGERVFNTYGGRTFLCWNPRGLALPPPAGAFAGKSSAVKKPTATAYKEALKHTLTGWKNKLPESEGVVITAFDAATTGRLSLTYYNELLSSDFLDRLCYWDETCCWYNGQYGVQSPPLYQIASLAYGTPRDGRFVCDDGVLRQQMQRLISCRVDKGLFPFDIKRRLVERASRLASLGADARERLLFTACAVIQKYNFDRNETRWNMATDLNTRDRSFQFGRLLAVLERTEQHYYWRTGENRPADGAADGEKGARIERETNAIRMLPVYCRRPWSSYTEIDRKLRTAYLQRMKAWQRENYLNLTGEIVKIIDETDASQRNRPLEDSYLLGYHLQRLAMKSKKTDDTTQEETK